MDDSLPFLHLELTSKCALSCQACPRTIYSERIQPTELSLSAILELKKTQQKFREITLCGDHGDPIYHTDFHAVLLHLQELPGNPPIYIATNGSFRSRDWWKKTAQILRKGDNVLFGVDGIEGESAKHRVGSNWDSILTGMQTLKEFGKCKVSWQWILFEFNENQIPGAAQLAKNLKIDQFCFIYSSRYNETTLLKPKKSLEEAQHIFESAYDLPSL